MTKEELQAIKARCEAATPGPWICGPEGPYEAVTTEDFNDLLADWNRANNGRFIAGAREDIPALLAEVERLRVENHKLVDALIRIRDDDPGEPWLIAKKILD